MKIKYFSGEIDVKDSEVLADYLTDELGYANDRVVQAYADLLFKIHEKIEKLENARYENGVSYEYNPETASVQEWGMMLLKSLLENDK